MTTGFEPDEWLMVWTTSAERSLSFFNLDAATHEVKVLADGPQTEGDKRRYKPEAKLFGIRAVPAVPGSHSTPDVRKG